MYIAYVTLEALIDSEHVLMTISIAPCKDLFQIDNKWCTKY